MITLATTLEKILIKNDNQLDKASQCHAATKEIIKYLLSPAKSKFCLKRILEDSMLKLDYSAYVRHYHAQDLTKLGIESLPLERFCASMCMKEEDMPSEEYIPH